MIDAKRALKKLIEGNARYAKGRMRHPNQDRKRIKDVSKGQKPFAVVVCCSDSRVPPEIIFDQGIGDIFIVRTAGNVVDEIALGSIQYAVEHLHVKLVVVLGHKRCGAIDGCVKGTDARGELKKVMDAIEPAVRKVRGQAGDLVENAVRENIQLTIEMIQKSLQSISITIKTLSAYYDLDDGSVEFY